jgi:hypothetical protein
MFGIVLRMIGFVSLPVLRFLSYKGWTKGLRSELPPWRNALCVSAPLLLFLNWLVAVDLEAPAFVNPRIPRPAGLMEAMFTFSHPMGYPRGPSRLCSPAYF